MRDDLFGMFWDDTPVPKVKKTKDKRTPPEPVWTEPGYYDPEQYQRALAYVMPHFSDDELMRACTARELLKFDVESYPNFWCVSFWSEKLQRVAYFEISEWATCDLGKLRWILENFTLVGFNSKSYDIYQVQLAVGGWDEGQLFEATIAMIRDDVGGGDIMRAHKVKRIKIDHIDLIEVCPLNGSLKAYGARLFAEEIQDLPFPVGTWLTPEQALIVRVYNINDLRLTVLIFQNLINELELRASMSTQYGIDLRSKSDAQVAEAVIGAELERLSGFKPERQPVEVGKRFKYQIPSFLKYETPLFNWMLDNVRNAVFEIGEDGYIISPKDIEMKLEVDGHLYTMGIGGLHSNEQSVAHFTDDEHEILDDDVTAFYPRMMLNAGMYPAACGPYFLHIFKSIVERRVAAKKAGNKKEADSLKITINGTFGKLGSPWSIFYAPELLLQVTLTGQLVLLMLIERMKLAGITVVSANTDGIVMKVPRHLKEVYKQIIKQWELDTNLEMEETAYRFIASRDVNSYMAVGMDGKVKGKGAYSNVWWAKGMEIFRFHKNPVTLVCTRAVEDYLATGKSPVDTVYECTDPVYFTNTRSVKGGGVLNGKMIGKVARWYYSTQGTEVVYASSGNLVATSTGAAPAMQLPRELPADLDRSWYVAQALDMIRDLGLEPPVPRYVAPT